ncbi:MAG: membrane-bound lytic murein transglycosylase MltF [Betaproteobacteria bacterium]|nr:membrane-bound lytic murein transglycosylase MltF [Betaproteobacteria bacterium]
MLRTVARIIGVATLLTACGPTSDTDPNQAKDLLVLTRQGPTTFYTGPEGKPVGLEFDLATMFGQYLGRRLRFELADSAADIGAQVAAGRVAFAAAGLGKHHPAPPEVIWGPTYQSIQPVLVYYTELPPPRDWQDVGKAPIGVVDGFGHRDLLEAARSEALELSPLAHDFHDQEPLLERVAQGEIPYALADSHALAVVRNLFLDLDSAFSVGPPRELAWMFAPGQDELVEEAKAFFRMIHENGVLARLIDRYYGHTERVDPIESERMQEKARSLLPLYRQDFQSAQDLTGIEWRLLAALAYQESHWDPLATSPTNVRGMMMLTEETAQRMNVLDRLDPKQSILAGAKYLVQLKRMLPERILEPDRTWLALAAYNIGYGHLEDARVLAQRRKLNPDAWSDLKKTLPLLARAEHADTVKHGFARGGAPVIFVENIRAYYDIINRMEAAHLPRLHAGPDCRSGNLRAC